MSRDPGGFRARTNGARGYANGDYGNGGYGQYDGARDNDYGYQERPSSERRRDRRPGGYGGLDESDEAPQVSRPTNLNRTRANRRSGDRNSDSSRSRSRPGAGFGTGSQEMEEILEYTKRNWEFMTSDNCVPIQTALKLSDTSSLGLASQYDQFRQTHEDLQRALKKIVNEHHQGFNSSIGTFHMIQHSITSSQSRVRKLKDSLSNAKLSLSTTKPELKEFATTSQKYDEMIQMLNIIEQLRDVPDKLEARISEKRFLTAVDILQDALRQIRRSEMENIGALSDLRIYLSNQEHSLTDILIEELHNHLYLKSPYCEDRWKGYANRAQADLHVRSMYQFLDTLDTSEPMTDDSPQNPEADTFQYIQLLVEALSKMGDLEGAVNAVEERLPTELFKVVERANNEVTLRRPAEVRTFAMKQGTRHDVETDDSKSRTDLLSDLLSTLYARFEAIAESHRVVHEVISGILRRQGVRDPTSSPLSRGFKELWKLYQSEIRSLLHDYLATEGDWAYRGGQGQAKGGSAFSRAPRDRNKRMFKLTDMDTKASEISQEREDLEFILKSSVPGLVSDSKRPDDISANNSASLDGSATGHKLLVPPSVFNMGILLPPSLEFLNRLKEVVPSSSDIVMSTLTSFLDHFLINTFLPQLEETLIDMSSRQLIDVDGFQQEPQWRRFSKRPICKGTAKFFTLITAFCKMLDNLPHDQAMSQLLIDQMSTYYEKCNGTYKALVTRGQAKPNGRLLKAPAASASSGEIADTISSLFQAEPESALALVDKEIELLMAEVESDPLDEADLVQDKKTLTSLCLLHTSMKWLATKIAQLRFISDRSTDSNSRDAAIRNNRRWTLLASSEARTEGNPVYLPLNKETATAFDKVVRSYQSLSSLILRTLHLSLRTQILHSLTTTIQPTYILDTLLNEPSHDILTLNNALVAFDAEVSTYIPEATYPLLTTGLSKLMDTYLLHLSTRISRINENGAALMQLNILVLQQNLKNIDAQASLPLSALYFEMFSAGPDAIVARAKETGKGFGVEGDKFSYEVVKGLVELWYSGVILDERREVGERAKRERDAKVLEISEFLY
ncbi:Sec8 exocyst complex component-specific domain-containing protein [Lophiotrema nucula]|uniref:Exocyst complex component Sec8 n=1 Tax=Lophiotrema nucula TaxID=690887 RepID=A0A6A5Z6C3_9PLEO|nr:Sec8 exocyst complex component-specific domain-containing protein [Lophiotrema nucula]